MKKKKIFSVLGVTLCVVAVAISIFSLRFDDKIGDKITNVISTNTNNIDTFIESVASVLLSSYEIDITGDVLREDQKKYITDMYILQNREKYIDIITDDNGKNIINVLDYKAAYYYLFNESYNDGNDGYVYLNDLNMEKFHINSYSILSYGSENDIHKVKVEYTQKFLDKEFSCTANYSIGYGDNKYYLVGFTISR